MTYRKQPSPPGAQELRTSTAGAELREQGSDRYCHGLGIVFDTEEEIFPGLFEKVERGAVQPVKPVRCYFNHDPNKVLGSQSSNPPLRLEESAAGLHYSCPLATDVTYVRDLVENLRRGNVSGSSFAFMVPPGGDTVTEDTDGNIHRTIHRLELYEVGPVVTPAYSTTSATVRAHAEQLVQAWRSLGRVEPAKSTRPTSTTKRHNGTAIPPALRAKLDLVEAKALGFLVPLSGRQRINRRRESELLVRHGRIKKEIDEE